MSLKDALESDRGPDGGHKGIVRGDIETITGSELEITRKTHFDLPREHPSN